MGRKHGRAYIPWGKFKGYRVRLLPDSYLSWLTTTFVMTAPEWRWLKESLIAELKFRGLRYDLAQTADAFIEDCLATVPPYWNTLLQCTSETCHRPRPCPVHESEPETEKPKFLLEAKRAIHLE